MSQTCTELRILVHLVDALACKEVQTIKVLLVRWEEKFLLWVLHADACLENGALTLLYPLSHRMQVGGEVTRSRIDTLAVLALALAEELLPPLSIVMQLGLVVDEDLNLLAVAVESITHSSVDGCWVFLERHINSTLLLHSLSTSHELLDVDAGTCYRQQTNRGED